jgi:tetratricopeptide (TPR) repeat protein
MVIGLKSRPVLVLLLLLSTFCIAVAQNNHAVKGAQGASSPYRNEVASAAAASLADREQELHRAIAAQPQSADLLYELALVLRQERKINESLGVYTRAAALRKPTAEQLRSVAIDYVLLNDYEDAIRWLQVAVRMEPRNTDALYALGRCYYSKQSFADASTVYQAILAIDPHHLKAEENLGLVFDATNQPARADQALRTAASWADQNGSDEWPFLDFGSFLLDQDRPQEALDPLRIASRIRPDSAICHEKLGRTMLAMHDAKGGIAELERATELDPSNPKTHYELGRAYRQSGQAERARTEFAISQKLYSTHSQE